MKKMAKKIAKKTGKSAIAPLIGAGKVVKGYGKAVKTPYNMAKKAAKKGKK